MRIARWSVALAAGVAIAACSGAATSNPDRDGDGHAAATDCDDGDPAVHAGVIAYADADGDGFGAGAPVALCTDGNVPAGYAVAGGDCASQDPAAWRTLDLVDRDGDGRTATDVPICVGASAPEPYREMASGNDCDDANADLYRWIVAYRDQDGDGLGAGVRSILCLGAALPSAWSSVGGDGNDADPAVGRTFTDDDLARILD